MSSKASAGSTFEFWQKNYIYLPFYPILILLGVNKIGYLIFCNTFLGGKKGLLSIRHGLQDICLLCLMHGGLSTTHLREAFQLLLPLNVALPIASIMGLQILLIELTSAIGLFLPFIRRPNTCIVVWQQLICCWSCQPALQCCLLDARGSQTIPKGRSLHNKLCIMCSSVMTMAAISLDRLLALLLGLKYRQIVALKPTYIQVLSDAAVLSFILNYIWYTHVTRPSYLLISITSYTKIFGALSHHIYCLNCLLDCSCCCCSMYHF